LPNASYKDEKKNSIAISFVSERKQQIEWH